MRWLIFIVFILSVSFEANAQHSLGISINYGDRLTFTPNYPGLFLKRNSISPNLAYSFQRKFRSDFSIFFSGQVGIAAYQLIPVVHDTLGSAGSRFPFVDYGIFVSKIDVTSGKTFNIGKRELFVGLGGGISYYLVFPYAEMYAFMYTQRGMVKVFYSYVEAPSSGTIAGFAKLYMRIPVSRRLGLVFQYSRQWKPILKGGYEFFNTNAQVLGTIKLVPKGISLMLFYHFLNKAKS